MTGVKDILVVEDEPSIRFALTAHLKDIPGVRIAEARSVDKAQQLIERVSEERRFFTLAVVDLRLPWRGQADIDGGFEVIRCIRRLSPDTAIIVITVRGDLKARERAEKEYGCSFLVKPWRKSELTDLAMRIIRGQDSGLTKP